MYLERREKRDLGTVVDDFLQRYQGKPGFQGVAISQNRLQIYFFGSEGDFQNAFGQLKFFQGYPLERLHTPTLKPALMVL